MDTLRVSWQLYTCMQEAFLRCQNLPSCKNGESAVVVLQNYSSGANSGWPETFQVDEHVPIMYESHTIGTKPKAFRSMWMVTWKWFSHFVNTERHFRFRYPLGSYNIKRFHDLHLKVCFAAGPQHCTGPPRPNGATTTRFLNTWAILKHAMISILQFARRRDVLFHKLISLWIK